MIPEDKILIFDIQKLPEGISVKEYLEYLETLENPELEEGCTLINKYSKDETRL